MGRRDRRARDTIQSDLSTDNRDDQHNESHARKHSHSSSGHSSPDRLKRQRSDEHHASEKDETPLRNHRNKQKEDVKDGESPFRLFKLSPSESLIALQESDTVVMKGKVQLKCLYGEVEVLGFKLKPDDKSYDVFSPETNTNVSLQGKKGVILEKISKELRKYIQSIGGYEETEISDFLKDGTKSRKNNSVCVLHAKKLDSSVCDFVSSISIYRNVFQCVSDSSKSNQLGVDLLPECEAECVSIPTDYKILSASFMSAVNKGKSPIMAVCGGKNVGKSTLCRYIVNSCLNSCGDVAYLECDIGQTELTPSGCLSLSIVSQPLLGPPFTHQKQPLCNIFFGALTPGDDPGRYLKCVMYLINKYQQLENRPPLIVNTMGWNKGLGISILIDTVKAIQPTFVVQIDSGSRAKNMPNLVPEFFDLTPGWESIDLDAEKSFTEVSLKFKHVVLHSPVRHEHESSERYKAPDHRNLSLMSYLGQMMKQTTLLHSLRPYKVPWHSVAIHICHAPVPNSQILGTLNASVVALCTVEQSTMLKPDDDSLPRYLADTPVCDCLGFGVVRSIDEVEKVFHVLTPLKLPQLQSVNCLLRGALDLPQQVFMEQTSVADVPYIGYPKDGIGATSNKRRRHLQRHRPSDK